jgi:dTDP-4-amino-4,6-dideoxygalactose transaminase
MSSLPAIEGGPPVRKDFLVFGAPSITEAEIAEVVDTLRSGWIGTGPKSRRFEEEFAAYVGAEHAVAVNSCTAALHLSLLAAGCGPGDEVITSALTFAATVNSIVHTGATPLLADVHPDTLNVTVETLEAAVTAHTRAIVPVHFGGLPCDLDSIYQLAKTYGIMVIEDCAHAVGAEYKQRSIGSSAGLSCFSFYPNKNLTTCEGGMVTTPESELAEKLSVWRLHGLDRDAWRRFQTKDVMLSWCVFPGFKYNLTDLAASLGLHQLRRLPEMLAVREKYAGLLDQAVDQWSGVRRQYRPAARQEARHGLHLYTLIVDPTAFFVDRNHLVAALREEGIGAAIHYEAVHRHPHYRELLALGDEDVPWAARIGETILSLPMNPSMCSSDLEDVIDACEKVFAYYRR